MGDTETEDVKVIPLDNLGEELQEKPVEPSPEPCFIWTRAWLCLFRLQPCLLSSAHATFSY